MLNQTGEDVRVYVVWVPMNRGLERDIANATKEIPDSRARHYWDGDKQLVNGYQTLLKMSEPAWDTFVLYGPGTKWEAEAPPAPAYWMHQLGSARNPRVNGPYWDARVFAERVRAVTKP